MASEQWEQVSSPGGGQHSSVAGGVFVGTVPGQHRGMFEHCADLDIRERAGRMKWTSDVSSTNRRCSMLACCAGVYEAFWMVHGEVNGRNTLFNVSMVLR